MKDHTLINDKKKAMQIFYSLMDVQLHGSVSKSLQNMLREQKKAEMEGKLRIYYPEAL